MSDLIPVKRRATVRHMAKQSKDTALHLRMPESLRSSCEAEASRLGLDLSSWVRMVLTRATKGK